jgi:hypothetical protein
MNDAMGTRQLETKQRRFSAMIQLNLRLSAATPPFNANLLARRSPASPKCSAPQ